MTDNELRALVASIAEGQKKTDAQLAKTDAQLAKTDAQLAKTDAQLDRNAIQQAKTEAQLAQTDARLARTCEKVDKLAEMYGGMSNNQGSEVEQFYYNSLRMNPVLQGIYFEEIHRNLRRVRQGVEDEYDILMVNTKAVYIIEVKYKAHPNDLEKMIHKKAFDFPTLFQEYTDFEQHLGLACFHIDDALVEEAINMGVNILQRKGEIFEISAAKRA